MLCVLSLWPTWLSTLRSATKWRRPKDVRRRFTTWCEHHGIWIPCDDPISRNSKWNFINSSWPPLELILPTSCFLQPLLIHHQTSISLQNQYANVVIICRKFHYWMRWRNHHPNHYQQKHIHTHIHSHITISIQQLFIF